MGNVNIEATQAHMRNNEHASWKTVGDAVKALDNQDAMMSEDIVELYTRDASRANRSDIAIEYTEDHHNIYVNDLVYYGGTLWRCVNNHPAGTEWNTDDFVIAVLGDLVTALINAPAPETGLSYYVETHIAQSDSAFSHTFARQPKAILQMVQPATAVGELVSIITPITFDDSGNLINKALRIIRQNNQISEETLTWDSSTLTLTYSAVDWDLAFNRVDSKIVYLA